MSAFIPPTPDDADALAAALNERAAQMDAEDFRALQFHALVPDVTGPVGPLLRMIAHVDNEYAKAKSQYGTTEGEGRRHGQVFDAALDVFDALRAGEQS